VDGRDKPGHDEKASHFQAVRKSLKILDAFWVRLLGLQVRRAVPHKVSRPAAEAPTGAGDKSVGSLSGHGVNCTGAKPIQFYGTFRYSL
jgi:hypothetical protein